MFLAYYKGYYKGYRGTWEEKRNGARHLGSDTKSFLPSLCAPPSRNLHMFSYQGGLWMLSFWGCMNTEATQGLPPTTEHIKKYKDTGIWSIFMSCVPGHWKKTKYVFHNFILPLLLTLTQSVAMNCFTGQVLFPAVTLSSARAASSSPLAHRELGRCKKPKWAPSYCFFSKACLLVNFTPQALFVWHYFQKSPASLKCVSSELFLTLDEDKISF